MKYGKRKIFFYETIINILVTLLCMTAFIIGQKMGESMGILKQLLAGGVLGTVAMVILLTRDYLLKKLEYQEKGVFGENNFEKRIKEELIGKNFRMISGIKNHKGGDIDFVLICRHGVYCVEVKNIRGVVKYDRERDELLVNNFKKRYHKQVRGNAMEIQERLNKNNIEIKFVIPVLVMFSCTLVGVDEEIRHGTRVYYLSKFIDYIKELDRRERDAKVDVEKVYEILR